MYRKNALKKKLQSGEPALACWLHLCSPIAAEVVALTGYDAVIIDHEHGPGDFLNAVSLMQAAAGTETTYLMRVPWNDMVYIKRALDIGAQGIMVPYIQTAAEARAAVAACRYPMAGVRGVAPHIGRCSDFGLHLKEYLADSPDNLLVMCQIETQTSVDNLREIAAVDGVDMLIIGPSDLSASAGRLGQPDHPDARALIERAEEEARGSGALMGTVLRPGKTASDLFGMGYDLVISASDLTLLRDAALAQVTAHRTGEKARKG